MINDADPDVNSKNRSSVDMPDGAKTGWSLLLVDDDNVLADLWQCYLQDIGCSVDSCSTVEDAEILLNSNDYQLLIVDIFLREGGKMLAEGGITLINRIRLREAFGTHPQRRLPVLAVTGAPERAGGKFSAISTVEKLADGVLHKPVRLEQLGLEICRLCNAVN